MQSVKEKVYEALQDFLGVKESEIELDSDIILDLGADSLDTVELIMEFEEQFDMQIEDEVAEKLTTVKQIIDYIEENKK